MQFILRLCKIKKESASATASLLRKGRKNMTKKILFWVGLGVLAVALAFGIFLLCRYLYTMEVPRTTEPVIQETIPTEATTEPTAPPLVRTELTAEDFVVVDGVMTCTAMPSRIGIDVSGFQGDIDWQAVADAGVTFAIIRVGGRGYGEAGGLYGDSKALQNYEGAKAAGLDVGVYFFAQAISAEEAVEEAEYVLQQIEGWELTMPVVYDWEYIGETARTANVEPQTLTDCMNAFCARIRQAGHKSMVYFNYDLFREMFYMDEVLDSTFWLAKYSGEMTFPYKVDMWQYTNKGTVPGIAGNVDMNIQLLHEEME